jgi:1,2-dihydroxy-3-keto-5-methylthiopentene dioxygenase
MALLKIPDEDRTITDGDPFVAFSRRLASTTSVRRRIGIDPGLHGDEILAAWAPKIDDLKARGGYVVADVIDVKPRRRTSMRCSSDFERALAR